MVKSQEAQGRLVWDIIRDYYREKAYANRDVYMSWEELELETQAYYTHIGDSMFTLFRRTESNEVLREKLEESEKRFEQFRAAMQKHNKEMGGR
jgi:hypothetical protein